MKWFRMYHEARTDEKLKSLSDAEFRVWFRIMCYANEQETRGVIPRKKDRLMAIEVSNGDVDLYRSVLEALVDLEIAHVDEAQIKILHWDKRQFQSDQSTDRWRKWKDKQKTNVGQTLANGEQTASQRQLTPPDTDTETDPDSEQNTTTSTRGESPDSDQSDKPNKPYEVVEALMQQMMVKPNYILKTTDYHALKTLLDAKIPLDFIVEGIGFAFDQFKKRKKPGTINSFTYCAPIIQEAWDLKNAEREVAATNRTGRNSQKQLVALGSQGSTSGGRKDDRYSAFYQLFPDS